MVSALGPTAKEADLHTRTAVAMLDAMPRHALRRFVGIAMAWRQSRPRWRTDLATSIKQGTGTASLMLKKLGSYPRQNGRALALRELGRIERTLFILDWLQGTQLRRRGNAGLNKGKARNALARAWFFNHLGEFRAAASTSSATGPAV